MTQQFAVQVNFFRPSGAGVETYWATVNCPGTYSEADKLAYDTAILNEVCTRVTCTGAVPGNVAVVKEFGTQYPPKDVRTWARDCEDALLPKPEAKGWIVAEENALRDILGS